MINLQNTQQNRLVSKFDEYLNKELNKSIEKIINTMNGQLREFEQIIKQFFTGQIDDELQNMIKMNMKQALLTNLTNFTKKFKLNQKIYSEKYKEFVGEEDPTFDLSNNFEESLNESKGGFLKLENKMQLRDNELNLLLNNVNELATIFKDIQTLVMEQGSILDRIDYNIEVAGDNVVKGKKSLEKANEYHKKNCFRNALLILTIVIFVEVIMLIFKFL